ncbi:MAG TPA: radical SAM protein [Bacillota bacterium]|nr:radical SAM protein [Bacillota bacterium]
MAGRQPGYLRLADSGELERRAALLQERLQSCVICPHHCRVNRLANERGFCRAGARAVISSYGPHYGEEAPLVGQGGSGTIFFCYCTLRCIFCQNYEISHYGLGEEASPSEIARMMLSLQKKGCHNINLVSPTHYIPQIVLGLSLAVQEGLTLPLVYNTGGYDDLDTLKLLEGIVDIYMPDLKFGDNDKARKYTKAANYFDLAAAAVKEMQRQVGTLKLDERQIAYRGLLIRHLVLPYNLAAMDRVLEFIAAELPGETAVNIMAQYHPAHQADQFPELAARITGQEYAGAVRYARELGLSNLL